MICNSQSNMYFCACILDPHSQKTIIYMNHLIICTLFTAETMIEEVKIVINMLMLCMTIKIPVKQNNDRRSQNSHIFFNL